ncbi:hypothetical protein, partial [Porphyromonas loveana]|uniref:hypothetical protein n=1 Tax=Porphyromonas loveana TaxID=1884669 RepID=UPI00359FB057
SPQNSVGGLIRSGLNSIERKVQLRKQNFFNLTYSKTWSIFIFFLSGKDKVHAPIHRQSKRVIAQS